MTLIIPPFFSYGVLPSGQRIGYLRTLTDTTVRVYWFTAPRGGKLFIRTYQTATGVSFWYSLGVAGYDTTNQIVTPIQYWAETLSADTAKTVDIAPASFPQALQWACLGCTATATVKAFLGIEVYD